MDTRDNKFKHMDDVAEEDKQHLIPFTIGEQVIVKEYRFEVEKVDTDANLLVLKPLGKVQTQTVNFKREMGKLKAKGGLGR